MNWLDVTRAPDKVSVQGGSSWWSMKRSSTSWTHDDVQVETCPKQEAVAVLVTAEHSALSCVHLRWDLDVPRGLRVLA